MKASGRRASSSMRVLSPRIDPPERPDDGSTASTASRVPLLDTWHPNASMNVDLPDPGAPEMPSRGTSRCGADRLEQLHRLVPVVGAGRLHQGDRPPQQAPVAGEHVVGEAHGSVRGRSARAGRGPCGGLEDVGAGPEDGGDAGVVEEVVVLGRDHAAADHDHVVGAGGPELVDQLRARASCARRPGTRCRRRARPARRRRGPPPPGSGTAGRCRRRSRSRRTRWR